jgi:hypothetical protein
MIPNRNVVAMRRKPARGIARVALGTFGLAAAGYAAATAAAWTRYGHVPRGRSDEQDSMLDRFMPIYDVVERHRIRIDAPPHVTLAAAGSQPLMSNPIVRAVFKTRELVLGSTPPQHSMPLALLPQVLSMGWRVLAERPDREIVVGAVTKPWEANVTFRGLDADEFSAFNERGFVKIVWSLRADPVGPDRSIFRTETRAIATDNDARARFRRYWAFASPGIWLIRRASLGPLKRAAERRATAS